MRPYTGPEILVALKGMLAGHRWLRGLPMYDEQLIQVIDEAFLRITYDLEQAPPFMAGRVSSWMCQLHPSGPADYFQHPLAFPMLLLPWWAEKKLCQNPDSAFQSDLVYSTIHGYYYIRLMDDVMDGHTTAELELLPVLGYFHTQFQRPYQPYFGHDHPFWGSFTSDWFQSAAATMEDASLPDLDQVQFKGVAARKTCAAKIPVAAVCYKYDRPDLIAPWSQFLDSFGCWHQMWNDVLGWRSDMKNQVRTLFLAEADRQRDPAETVTEWVIRRGFDWGMGLVQMWMTEARELATSLDSEDLMLYLDTRELLLTEQKGRIGDGLSTAAKLLDLPEVI